MSETFTTTLIKDDSSNATGIQVPEEVVSALGPGKKHKVKVTIQGITYRSTIAVFGGKYFLPLSAERRQAAGVKAGDIIEVMVELDTEERTVVVPPDLTEALINQQLLPAFDALSYTNRKESVRLVESAKSPETRTRRIEAILKKLIVSR